MEKNNPPEWAMEKALKLAVDAAESTSDADKPWWQLALARYIAEHEEEPVDPLLLEAREMLALHYDHSAKSYAARIRAGGVDAFADDISKEIGLVYATLKRGIELGKEQS